MRLFSSTILCLFFTASAGAETCSESQLDTATQILDKYVDQFMSLSGVTSVGVSCCKLSVGWNNGPSGHMACIIAGVEKATDIFPLEDQFGKAPAILQKIPLLYEVTGPLVPAPGGTSGNGQP